jgi:hypothetical protein
LEIDVNPLDFLLGKTKPASRGSVPGFPPPPKGRFPASFGAPRVPITSAATGTSRLLGPVATLADIYYQGSKVFNPKDNIITSIQDLSTSIGNQFAKPGQEGRYVGSNPIAVRANRELDFRNRSYYGPAHASAEALGLGTPGSSLRDYGPGYKERELAAGAAAEQFRPGAGFPGQQGAADRSYKEDLSRAKQLAEQDQLAKKYQVAELTKAYNTASPEEKSKIGLQIWATTNPELAQRLKPGQTGYSEAVTAFQSQSPLGAIAKAAGDVQYADLGNKAFTSPTGPGGVPLGFSPGQLQTPLTGIEIPSTDKIGVSEFFSNTTPAPGAMEAFTDPLSILSPEKLDNAKRALLIQAFNKSLK